MIKIEQVKEFDVVGIGVSYVLIILPLFITTFLSMPRAG